MRALKVLDGLLGEKCGLAGVYYSNPDDRRSAAHTTYVMLNAEQNRGDQGAGIVTFDHRYKMFRKEFGEGEADQALGKVNWDNMTGRAAIGHLLYSTVQNLGFPKSTYIQPIKSRSGEFCLGHNGTLEPKAFKGLMEKYGPMQNDSHAIVALLDDLYGKLGGDWQSILSEANKSLDGSYTCEVLTKSGEMVIFREPRGLKPMHYSRLQREDRTIGYAIASETTPINTVEKRADIKSLKPGEYAVIDGTTIEFGRFAAPIEPAHCSFEWVYFQKMTSTFEGKSNDEVRESLGRALARKDAGILDVDSAGPVPSSGRSAARGYTMESGLPPQEFFQINKVGRTFIKPKDGRGDSVKMKYSVNERAVRGKRIVIVDDSLVRATTAKKLVKLLKEYGVGEVHFRVSFPPVRYPCYHGGIAFSDEGELGINVFKDVEGVRKAIGADSLAYTDIGDLKEATGKEGICTACIDGLYPLNGGVVKFEDMKKRLEGLKTYVSG